MDVTLMIGGVAKGDAREPKTAPRAERDGPPFGAFLRDDFEAREPAARRADKHEPRRARARRSDDRNDGRAGVEAVRGRTEAQAPAREAGGPVAGGQREAHSGPGGLRAGEPSAEQSAEQPDAGDEVLRHRSLADLLGRLVLDRRGGSLPEPAGAVDPVTLDTRALAAAVDAAAMAGDGLEPDARLLDGAPADGPTTVRLFGAPPPTFGRGAETAPTAAATTLSLPGDADPTAIVRQISDALRLRGDGRNQTTEIELHPAELGRVRLRVEMHAGAVRVLVAAEHARVGDLMAANLEQLRQQLLAQGVQSAHVEVGDFQLAQRGPGDFGGDEGQQAHEEDGTEPEAPRSLPGAGVSPARRRADGRIDLQA